MSVDLQEWANANVPADDLRWKSGFWDQICFVRDELGWMLRDDEGKRAPVTVASTHTSKSIRLPVYEINACGLKIRLRYNFFNWIVSVEADSYMAGRYAIVDKFCDLFDRSAVVLPCYAEGFKDEWVFGSYKDDPTKFTTSLGSKYDLYAFCLLLRGRHT